MEITKDNATQLVADSILGRARQPMNWRKLHENEIIWTK